MRDARTVAAALVMAVVSTLGVVFYESLSNGSILEGMSSTTRSDAAEQGRHHSLGRDAWKSLCDANGTLLVDSSAIRITTKTEEPKRPTTTPNVNDMTIELSPCVQRPWVLLDAVVANNNDNVSSSSNASHAGTPTATSLLSKMSAFRGRRDKPKGQPQQYPPYKVLLTNFGWNHPDQSVGMNVSRSVRSREFVTGIVNHPYFDPTDWDEVNRRILADRNSDNTRYYVFLDVETCYESNYPVYGGGPAKNLDALKGRVAYQDRIHFNCYMAPQCPYIRRVLDSPLFRTRPTRTKLLFFDCRGNSMSAVQRQQLLSDQFAVMSYSAGNDQHDTRVDQGLAPPAVTKVVLSANEVRDIERCDAESNRSYLFSFVGSVRNVPRSELIKLHDKSQGIIALPLMQYQDELARGITPITFTDLLRQSVFAGAPIGDNRFSYRFAEVLAAGAIPVVHSDGWVLPFRPELVDWSECLLHLPEASIPDTIHILNNITREKRCQMRQRCREIHTTYMSDGAGTIRGIVDGIELVWASTATTKAANGSSDSSSRRRVR